MEVPTDFKELLVLFNGNHVEYMIVGGYALAFHGAPRFTGDLDLFVNPTMDNAARVVAALHAFGFGSLGLTSNDFDRPDHVVQLGVSPVRIDLVTSITGLYFATSRATVFTFRNVDRTLTRFSKSVFETLDSLCLTLQSQ